MPYKSDKQRRYMHWAASKGKIDKKVVKEFDEASKGMDLPEKAKSAAAAMADELSRILSS